MNERTVRMVQRLAHAADPCTISDLAHHFSVSDRTIRNDIKSLNRFLGQQSLGAVNFGPKGLIVLPTDFYRVEELLPVEDTFAYKMSSEERIQLGAAMLLSAPDYVTLQDIAESFSVSRATILNDLDGIKKTVASLGLSVESKPGHGVRATGSESLRRLVLADFISKEAPIVDQWISLPINSGIRSISITVKRIVNERCHAAGIHMADSAFQRAVSHLCICVFRNKQGKRLESLGSSFKGCTKDDISEFEHGIVTLVAQYCSTEMGPDEELFFASVIQPYRSASGSQYDTDDFRVKKLTRSFIRIVSQSIDVNLNGDYDLFEYLSNHLQSMFSTEPSHFPESPAIDEVIDDQPEVFKAVQDNLAPIEGYAGRRITPTETKYIALHVCAALERKRNSGSRPPRVIVVCNGGIGTSQLLAEELRGHFDIKIVKVLPAHDVPYIRMYDADLVISTVRLENCPIDSIVIKLPIRDKEYGAIHKKLHSIALSAKASGSTADELSAQGLMSQLAPVIGKYEGKDGPLYHEIRSEVMRYFHSAQNLEGQILLPYLHQLLPVSHIQLDIKCTDWRDAIRKSAEPLLDMGYIEKRYIDAMISGVEKYGTYDVLAPGFAVPHSSPENGAIKMGMSLIRLSEPVAFADDKSKPIDFVCTLSAVDGKTHLKAFANLLDLITMPNNAFISALRNASSATEAASIIEHFEYDLVR